MNEHGFGRTIYALMLMAVLPVSAQESTSTGQQEEPRAMAPARKQTPANTSARERARAPAPAPAQRQVAARGLAQGTDLPSTLSEAIERATASRLEAQLGDIDLQGARARLKAARAGNYPRLGLAVDFRRIHRWDNFTGVTANADIPGYGPVRVDVGSNTPRHQLFPRLEASYDIYAGGRHAAGIRHAVLQEQSSVLNQGIIRRRIVFEVASTWLQWRRHCIDWSSADAEVALSRRQLELARKRHRAGRMSDIDWHAAQAAHEEKRMLRESRAEAVHAAHARHVASIHNEPGEPRPISTACSFRSDPATDIRTLMAMMRAQQHGEQVRERHLRDIEAARERIDIEKAADRPVVSLIAQYAHGARHDRHGELLSSMRRQEGLIGIRVSWNLFDGYLSEARVEAAHAELERHRLAHALHASRVKRRQQEGEGRERDAGLATTLAHTRLELATARRALAEEQQRAGRASRLDVEESRVAELLARNAMTQADIDRAAARLEGFHADTLADEAGG